MIRKINRSRPWQAALLVCAFLPLFPAFGGDEPAAADPDAQFAEWAKLSAPGEQHKLLARLAGDWDVKSSFWFQPGAEPTHATGESRNQMELGGRYLISRYTSEVMGQPFEGIGTSAYNRVAGKFMETWIDSLGTGILEMTGHVTEDGAAIITTGEYLEPATKERIKTKSVTTFLDKDHYKIEMFNLMPDGSEFRSMELIYTRK